MKKLSDQLSDLSDRTRKTEDTVAAARAKDRALLEKQKASLQTSIDSRISETRTDVTSKWQEAQDAISAHFASLRENSAERHAERDLKKAERRADDAEQDAADAIDFALYILEQTDYAIADAVLARAEADDLAVG